jgi:hypothetical protein
MSEGSDIWTRLIETRVGFLTIESLNYDLEYNRELRVSILD